MINFVGPWRQTIGGLMEAGRRMPRILGAALDAEAEFFREKVVEGIMNQAPGGRRFRSLARSTLATRAFLGHQGSRALLVTGELAGAITARRTRGKIFVGVPASARGGDGRPLDMVARLAENGGSISIPVTPRMRRFLFAALGGTPRQGGGARVDVIRIRIPARPIFRPVLDKYGGVKSAARVLRGVAGQLPFPFR